MQVQSSCLAHKIKPIVFLRCACRRRRRSCLRSLLSGHTYRDSITQTLQKFGHTVEALVSDHLLN